MADEHRILLIDDNPADRALAMALLRDRLPRVRVREVTGAVDFAELLGYRTWTAAIAEQTLSWASGAALLAAIKQRHPRCLTLLFTAAPPDAIDAVGEALGIDAYVRKDSAGYLRLAGILEQARRARIDAPGPPEHTLRGGLDAFPVGYFWCRSDGGLLDANAAFAELLGSSAPHALRERSLLDFLADPEDRERCARSLARGTRERFLAVRLGRPDGEALPVTLSFWPVPDGHGRECLEGIVWEASLELPRAAPETPARSPDAASADPPARLERSVEAAAETPGAAASRVVSLLRPSPAADPGPPPGTAPGEAIPEAVPAPDRPPLPAPPREPGLESNPEAKQAPTRPPPGPPARERSAESTDASLELDLAEALEAVPLKDTVLTAMDRLRPLIVAAGAHIRATPLPVLEANRSEMVRLFRELLENAIKFRGRDVPRISVRAEEHVDGWLISVRDNGIGIPSERRATLFDAGSPGSGLAICRRIARRYGGDIWVTSERGRGSTFFVALKARVAVRDKVTLSVQYNGETMGRIAVRNPKNKREIARTALTIPRLQGNLGERTIKHIQFIREGVVNIVA